MNRIIAFLLATTFILTSCVNTKKPNETKNLIPKSVSRDCSFSAHKGKEFVFREKSPSLQKYGYMSWKKTPYIAGERLSYFSYAGKHGKIEEKIVSGKNNSKWFAAITDTCEVIYSSAGSRNIKKTIGDLEKFTGIYFLDTLEKAKSIVGKEIWTKAPYGVKKAHDLFTPNPNITYTKGNVQKLQITGIDTKEYGHTYGASPFFLIVKTEAGKDALLNYSSKAFYETYPIKANWNNSIVKLINNQEVQRGMSKEQVLLSWGKPTKNNRTVGSNGVHEQWVYGNGQYLYFENNVLTSFQTSE